MDRLKKLTTFVRGDTPVIEVDVTTDLGEPIDLTDYSAHITITPDEAPTNLNQAIVPKLPMITDGSKARWQLPHSISVQFEPNKTYYGDIELTKSPAELNTYTPIRFTIVALTDFGV